MKTTDFNYVREFEANARETVTLAYKICEGRIKACKGNITPELKALTAAAVSLEKSVASFKTIEQILK